MVKFLPLQIPRCNHYSEFQLPREYHHSSVTARKPFQPCLNPWVDVWSREGLWTSASVTQGQTDTVAAEACKVSEKQGLGHFSAEGSAECLCWERWERNELPYINLSKAQQCSTVLNSIHDHRIPQV